MDSVTENQFVEEQAYLFLVEFCHDTFGERSPFGVPPEFD
jgi:hypothetical protein